MPAATRHWTVYIAQDKHLDYNWCGTRTEIERRMAALTDHYLDYAERGGHCNIDCTAWLDVYRAWRGEEAAGRPLGAGRLLDAVRQGRVGYGAAQAVLLWGVLPTELAIRALYGAAAIAQETGRPPDTALIMENPAMTWGVASVLAACGIPYLARGVYDLRAHSYLPNRDPYPLFWWRAPDGRRLLVHWDLYENTGSWGGYAEAYELARLAGEGWDAYTVRAVGDRNTDEVFAARSAWIEATVARYEAYGEAYPVSSILLLGSGYDNWTLSGDDYGAFIARYNAASDGRVRLVDARYDEYFAAVTAEVSREGLQLPELAGTFGICWEEWPAHLAGQSADWREAERLYRLAEAHQALTTLSPAAARDADAEANAARVRQELDQALAALLDFAEHDMGGCNRRMAVISAGRRADDVTQALDLARSLCPADAVVSRPRASQGLAADTPFGWRGGQVVFDPERAAVTSLVDAAGHAWVAADGDEAALGAFIHTLYTDDRRPEGVFPAALPHDPTPRLDRWRCERDLDGVAIHTEGERWGFAVTTNWRFHAREPWIDLTYRLADGWSDAPQAVRFAFPLALDTPTYRYDTAGAVVRAGARDAGGDDLPGANPELYAALTFAAAHDAARGAILLTPDAHLVQFGAQGTTAGSGITSLPMMNLTRNDWQFGQGGRRAWTFRYRLVLTEGPHDPLRPFFEAQRFGTPPHLWVDGTAPAVQALGALDIAFAGGPLLACKPAEDGGGLVLRFWNVCDRDMPGSLRLPPGYARAQLCDALERPQGALPVSDGRVAFVAAPRTIVTIALLPS